MPVWGVKFYDNVGDRAPSREGVIKAPTEQSAIAAAQKAQGAAMSFDLTLIDNPNEGRLPDGYTEFPQSKIR